MKKLLIVSEHVVLMMKIKEAAKLEGFEDIKFADNGILAMSQFKRQIPNVVIIDNDISMIKGTRLVKIFGDLDSNAKIFLLLGSGQERYIENSIEDSCVIISKPVSNETIMEVLRQ